MFGQTKNGSLWFTSARKVKEGFSPDDLRDHTRARFDITFLDDKLDTLRFVHYNPYRTTQRPLDILTILNPEVIAADNLADPLEGGQDFDQLPIELATSAIISARTCQRALAEQIAELSRGFAVRNARPGLVIPESNLGRQNLL